MIFLISLSLSDYMPRIISMYLLLVIYSFCRIIYPQSGPLDFAIVVPIDAVIESIQLAAGCLFFSFLPFSLDTYAQSHITV